MQQSFAIWVLFGFLAWVGGVAKAQVELYPPVVVPGGHVTVTYQGPYLPDQDFYFHYGFNGWNLNDPGYGFLPETYSSNWAWYRRQKMEWRWDYGRYATTITIPDRAKALHGAFCWNGCSVGQWDNNNQEDFNWAIQAPYIGPVLLLNEEDDPGTTLRIRFWNPNPIGAWLEYWLVDDPENRGEVISLRSQDHEFLLKDLLPGRSYQYKIHLDLYESTAISGFKTQRRDSQKIRFALLGDAQETGETNRLQDTVAAVLAIDDLDFVVGLGDYPWSATPGDWWTFFDVAGPLLSQRLFLPAAGNHDVSDLGFYEKFLGVARGEQRYRTHSVGPLQFLILDTNYEALDTWDRQMTWLQEEMASRPDHIKWKFVVGHHPVLQVATRHYGGNGQLRAMAKKFVGNVDWYFSGHIHTYQRSLPLVMEDDEFSLAPRLQDATRLLIAPPAAAAPFHSLLEDPELRALFAYPSPDETLEEFASSTGFVVVTIDGEEFNQFTLETFQFDADTGGFLRTEKVSYKKGD